jgi:APA family basic amino acid/polyamine antiporter
MVQSLGLFSSTALVVGSMIGSGIYLVDADIARVTDSPRSYLGAWVVTAIMTMICALSYGELAAMMPKAGGQYVYLRESLGPLWGFLYGWTLFLVIQTGTIAAVCVGFGKFLGVFFPVHLQHPLALAHRPRSADHARPHGAGQHGHRHQHRQPGRHRGRLPARLREYLRHEDRLADPERLHLGEGALAGRRSSCSPSPSAATPSPGRPTSAPGLHEFWRNAGWSTLHPVQVGVGGPIVLVNPVVILAVVQTGSLFSADAWNNITFTAGEVKNPKRNIPLSLVLGTGFVLTAYFLASLAYILVLPMHGDPHGATVLARGVQYAAEDRVGTATLEQIFPVGGALMAGPLLISAFGCANGLTLAGARVYYAMSRDGLFFKSVGKLHPKYKRPSPAC